MHRPWILIAAFLLAASAARGQNSDEAGQIKVLLERIGQLENRVSQLEAKLASNPPVPAATTLSAGKSEPQHVAAPGAPGFRGAGL